MATDEVGPPASGPARLIVPTEIRLARAAVTGARNGMPEPKRYVYGQSSGARAREARAARIAAHIRAQLIMESTDECE